MKDERHIWIFRWYIAPHFEEEKLFFFYSVQQVTFAQWFYFMIMILFSAFCTASVFGDKTPQKSNEILFSWDRMLEIN